MPDDRLRLIFTCCHPALAREAQVALTLRLVCGVSTGDIARAFLVSEPTMAARVTRAKKKISAARIPYRVPGASELPERLDAVLTVIHLLYTTGHTRAVRRRPGPRRPGGPRAAPDPHAAGPDARRAGGPRAARAAAAHRRPPGHPDRRRRAGCWCSRTRTGPPGTGPPSTRATAWSSTRSGPAASAGTRCRPPSPRCTPCAGSYADDRLAPGARALRRAAEGLALAGRRAQPGRGGVDGATDRRPPSTRSRSWSGTAGSPGTATCRPSGPTCCAGSAATARRRPPTARRWTSPTTRPSGTSSRPASPTSPRPAPVDHDVAARDAGVSRPPPHDRPGEGGNAAR